MRFRTSLDSPLRLLAKRIRHALRCSFCGKSENEVEKLISGPHVYICGECVSLCNQIIADAEIPTVPK